MGFAPLRCGRVAFRERERVCVCVYVSSSMLHEFKDIHPSDEQVARHATRNTQHASFLPSASCSIFVPVKCSDRSCRNVHAQHRASRCFSANISVSTTEFQNSQQTLVQTIIQTQAQANDLGFIDATHLTCWALEFGPMWKPYLV
jgi:hypothetical protein